MTTIRVAVNDYGVIGKRVADAVRAMADMELADVATNSQVRAAIGPDIAVFAATEQAGAAMRAAEVPLAGRLEDLLGQGDSVVDATPKGGAATNLDRNRAARAKAVLHDGKAHPPTGRPFVAHASYSTALCRATMEVHEIVEVVSTPQRGGLEVRHVESLRGHYTHALRAWVSNLESSYHEAVTLVGEGRARGWRLYLPGSVMGFESGDLQVHQSLAVKSESGRSAIPLRPHRDSPNPVRTGPVALRATA